MFVLVTELINSAVETAVDMLTDQYDPRAKAAKDLAAGAVLVAAMNALVVAYLVLPIVSPAPPSGLAKAIHELAASSHGYRVRRWSWRRS